MLQVAPTARWADGDFLLKTVKIQSNPQIFTENRKIIAAHRWISIENAGLYQNREICHRKP